LQALWHAALPCQQVALLAPVFPPPPPLCHPPPLAPQAIAAGLSEQLSAHVAPQHVLLVVRSALASPAAALGSVDAGGSGGVRIRDEITLRREELGSLPSARDGAPLL
jgi:hypothetical protein